MSQSLRSNVDDVDDCEVDDFPLVGDSESDSITEELRKEREQVKKLTKLFRGKRFFLGRECPRESLTFIIRSCGGLVSWDESVHGGASYPETDTAITHQVVDRPAPPETKYMNRYYVQPQWVYDCVNARALLEVRDYFPGVVLPPHLSPFASEGTDDYVPPERIQLLRRAELAEAGEADEEMEEEQSDDEEVRPGKKKAKREVISHATAEGAEPPPKKMKVKTGKVQRVDERRQTREEELEGKKLAVMMIPKKRKRLYNNIISSQKKKAQEVRALQEKRDLYEKKQKLVKKAAKSTKSGKKSITS